MDESLVSVEELHEGRLWILTFHEFSQQAADAWAEAVENYWAAHPDSTDRFLIYNVGSLVSFGISPYLRKRMDEINQQDRQATGRVAIVANVTMGVRHFVDSFIKMAGRRVQPKLEVRLFHDLDAAIAWVEEPLLE